MILTNYYNGQKKKNKTRFINVLILDDIPGGPHYHLSRPQSTKEKAVAMLIKFDAFENGVVHSMDAGSAYLSCHTFLQSKRQIRTRHCVGAQAS